MKESDKRFVLEPGDWVVVQLPPEEPEEEAEDTDVVQKGLDRR
jgi:hypothetical protein